MCSMLIAQHSPEMLGEAAGIFSADRIALADQHRGEVVALFVKETRGQSMTARAEIALQARFGIIGDCQARPLGPRQVLLVAAENLEAYHLPPDSLRANIVTRGISLDDLPSGAVLEVGKAAIRLTHRCEVCRRVTERVGPTVTKALVGRRGYLGVVLKGGQVSAGVGVAGLAVSYPAVPDALYERFAWVCSQIPTGSVCSFTNAVLLIGATRSYLRALPRWIRRGAIEGLPVHRLLSSQGCLLSCVEAHESKLLREGVEVFAGHVCLPAYEWDARQLYFARTAVTGQRQSVC
jgi:alkylated DNA nucleotide flippase Atl1